MWYFEMFQHMYRLCSIQVRASHLSLQTFIICSWFCNHHTGHGTPKPIFQLGLFTGMALSVLVVLLLAVLYEGIKVGKAKLLHKTLENLPSTSSQQLIPEPDQDSTGSGSTPANSTRLRYKPWVEGWPEHSLLS